MRSRTGTLFAAAALALSAATVASAQRPAGADTLSARAVAESLKVLDRIRKQLDKNNNDAALWYRRGMITWALYDRDRTAGGVRNLDWTRLGREADSSFRIAASIEPKNVRYRLSQGQYYLGTGWMLVRFQAYHVFDVALEIARKSGDPNILAEAAVEKGRVHWRRYDPADYGDVPADVRQKAKEIAEDTTLQATLLKEDIDTVDKENPLTRESLRAARRLLLAEFRRPDGGFDGEGDYFKAEAYFREAYAAAPTYPRAYQQLAMVLAERSRWTELAIIARTRIDRDAGDAWAWMTLGLASHRGGNQKHALAAFDSGLKRMSPEERKRLDNVARVMRPSDSAMVANWTAARRAQFERTYWEWSAPLWSREETQPRAEFLARVTYADLRWTVDELRKRGADSDRGTVFIRYGPADARIGHSGGETWWYDYARLTFNFASMPTFGTGYFVDADWALDVLDSVPSRWDNIARERVDSLPVRTTRFRAGMDSADVVFASFPPISAIRAAAAIDGPVRTDFWLFDGKTDVPVHDVGGTAVNAARAFTRRLALGDYAYRFEASAEGSLHAARAMATFTTKPGDSSTFATSGFGMSDLLVATRAEPRRGTRRWTDFDVDATAGSFAQGSEVSLLWENYDLAADSGSSKYEIKVTITRKYAMLLNRVRSRVISVLSAMMGSEQTEDRVIFRYERTAAHSPVLTDYVTIALEDLPSGNYDLTLDITDRVTGREASRTVRIVVRD